MGNFRSNSRGGFGGRSGGSYGSRSKFGGRGKFGGDRDSGRSDKMYDATCSKCGEECQVPFKPTGSKPVYCNDCFKYNNQRNLDGGPRSEASSEQFNQINAKLDRILRVLENLEIDLGEDDENVDEEDADDEDGEDSDDEDLEEEIEDGEDSDDK